MLASDELEEAKVGIKREEFYFDSSDGEARIRALAWTPKESPRAIVQLAHGMVEHIERYDDFARTLAASGYAVVGNDHIGHGKSLMHGSELGQLPVGANDIMIADVHTLRGIAQERFGSLPHIVFGHSMGSFVVRAYAARYGEGLAGLIACGSGQSRGVYALGELIARLIARIYGGDYRSRMLDNVAMGSYGRRLKGSTGPLDWLNTSAEKVQAYADDPECGFMFSAGGYASLIALIDESGSRECARNTPAELPVLFISGEQDIVGDYGTGVRRAADALAQTGHVDVEVRLYEGMRHEILQEPAHDIVYADVLDWLEERL